MKPITSFANISTTERYVRLVISVVAIIAAVEIGAGPALLAAIVFPAVVLAMTAVTGWDPLKSGLSGLKALLHIGPAHRAVTHGR